ncbi:hypothetical protein [Peribacillus loiseleuriae]|uniref:hypothetical protein n=2 Tax=Peribacillus loiseleuriae TaxID=1679170 RepID=UPI003D093CB3
MSDEKDSKPLFYIVQPKITEPERPEMQEVYRTKTKKKKGNDHTKGSEEVLTAENEEEHTKKEAEEAKEAKLDQIKREFGVYDALGEIKTELDSIQKIKNNLHEPEGNVRVISGANQENQVQEQQKDSPEVKKMRSVLTDLIKKDPKPFCEASIGGQTVRFQVISKRNDIVKIKVGSHIQSIPLHDLSDLTIL